MIPAAEQEARRALVRLDRRGFLRAAGTAAAATAAPLGLAGGGKVDPALLPPDPEALRQLSPRTHAVLLAAAQALLGPPLAGQVARGTLPVGLEVDRWADREPELGRLVVQALWVLELAPPPLAPKWRAFTGLSLAERTRVLDALMRGRLDLQRDVFRGIRSLVLVGAYGHPRGVRHTRHPGPFGAGGVAIAEAMIDPLEVGS